MLMVYILVPYNTSDNLLGLKALLLTLPMAEITGIESIQFLVTSEYAYGCNH